MTETSLSIVIGAAAGERSPAGCLTALAAQVDTSVEVILVTAEPYEGDGSVVTRRLVCPGGLVPELWAEGVKAARGELIGLLASTASPASDWVQRTRAAHREDDAAIGGPIEAGTGLSLVDWAVYFCRYARYMRPLSADAALEVPGDNASYRGSVLRKYDEIYEDGFWEPFVHAAMRADGHKMRFAPDRVVLHEAGASARGFARQRFSHGRAHGISRSQNLSRGRVLAGIATTPLVPPLMTARVAREVMAKRRHRGRFARALPLVFWFYLWWAAGELAGRLTVLRSGPTA